jgi:hypothetical protein
MEGGGGGSVVPLDCVMVRVITLCMKGECQQPNETDRHRSGVPVETSKKYGGSVRMPHAPSSMPGA